MLGRRWWPWSAEPLVDILFPEVGLLNCPALMDVTGCVRPLYVRRYVVLVLFGTDYVLYSSYTPWSEKRAPSSTVTPVLSLLSYIRPCVCVQHQTGVNDLASCRLLRRVFSCSRFQGQHTNAIPVSLLPIPTRSYEQQWLDKTKSSFWPPIAYYWTVPLILDQWYFVWNLKNSKIAETKALEPL